MFGDDIDEPIQFRDNNLFTDNNRSNPFAHSNQKDSHGCMTRSTNTKFLCFGQLKHSDKYMQ